MPLIFRLFIPLGIVGASAFFILNRSPAQSDEWQRGYQVLPPELQQQIRRENLQPGTPFSTELMRVFTVHKARQPLYLIDTRTAPPEDSDENSLCGVQNCLFLGYSDNRRVLNIYLNPHLPKNIKLIQPIDEQRENLPCLIINQLEQQKIHASKLCFNGTAYETVETQILPEVYE